MKRYYAAFGMYVMLAVAYLVLLAMEIFASSENRPVYMVLWPTFSAVFAFVAFKIWQSIRRMRRLYIEAADK